ncbi:MAG: DegT/DnrJ/EryC1/StrS family aminotransferase [Nitrospirae bacterium]|nr:DegT/DnrJ/EryC1/StrS family aminotransferase [Nitrospirota bacterium]
MKLNFIDLKRQYNKYKTDIDREIFEVLESTQFILGSKVSELEKQLAAYVGVRFGIGVSSGTDALLLALMAYGVKSGDEIICPPFTFIATAEVIALLGAKPVFVDIDEKTYNINPSLIEDKITDKTKGIIPVGLYGQVADMDTIYSIAQNRGLFVIEDGCQSFGATYKGRRSCGLPDVGVTSFFPSKPLGGYGDGGMVFTDNEDIAKKINSLHVHGEEKRYQHKYIGINGRLDAIQAAILLAKFKYLEEEIKLRQQKGAYYTDGLKDVVVAPYIESHNTSVYAQYSIMAGKKRDELTKYLNDNGVPTAIHYPKPLHLQEAFSYLDYSEGDFPVSEKTSKEILSLPMSPFITKDEQDYVIEKIREFYKGLSS